MQEQPFNPVIIANQGAIGRAARFLSDKINDTDGIATYSSVDVADFIKVEPELFWHWGGIAPLTMDTSLQAWRPFLEDLSKMAGQQSSKEDQGVLFNVERITVPVPPKTLKEMPYIPEVQLSWSDLYLALENMGSNAPSQDMEALKVVLLSPKKDIYSLEKYAHQYARVRAHHELDETTKQISGFLKERKKENYADFFAAGYRTLIGSDYRAHLGISKKETVNQYLSTMGLEAVRMGMVGTLNYFSQGRQWRDAIAVYQEQMATAARHFGITNTLFVRDVALRPVEKKMVQKSEAYLSQFPRLVFQQDAAQRNAPVKIDLRR